MLVYSQDRKSVLDADTIQIQKNISGKEAKYIISASAGARGAIVMGQYLEEEDATHELEKVFDAFSGGAAAYKF